MLLALWHMGKHLIIRFLRGARRLNPQDPIPSSDLSVVMAGLQRALFEPLKSVALNILSLKTVFLTKLTSIKRLGDLQAFSVDEFLFFGNLVWVFLHAQYSLFGKPMSFS